MVNVEKSWRNVIKTGLQPDHFWVYKVIKPIPHPLRKARG